MTALVTRRWLLLLIGLGLAGCGFRLAEGVSLPSGLETIRLETGGFERREREALVDRLRRAGGRVVDGEDPSAYQLRVRLQRSEDRRLVTSANTGRNVVRLERSLVFSLRDAAGETLVSNTTLVQQKDFRVDDDNLLASSEDRENALADLERELFDQLIRRLASI